jgi:hypothetical protein
MAGRRRIGRRSSGICGEAAVDGVDWGHLRSIRSSRRKKESRGISWRAWLLAGRWEMAGLCDVHGGELGAAERKQGRGRGVSQRERERKGLRGAV